MKARRRSSLLSGFSDRCADWLAVFLNEMMMDDLFYALTELMEAHDQYNRARNDYEGDSWGYHGQNYEDAINKARERFECAFKENVLRVIQENANIHLAR